MKYALAISMLLFSLSAVAGPSFYPIVGGGYAQVKLKAELPYEAKSEHSGMWSVGLGFKANDYFRLEASYLDLGRYSNKEHNSSSGVFNGQLFSVDENGSASARLTGLGFSAVISTAGKVAPFLRLGEFAHLSRNTDTRVQTGTNPATINFNGSHGIMSPMVGVGLAVGNLTLEYDIVHDVGLWQKANVGWAQLSYRIQF